MGWVPMTGQACQEHEVCASRIAKSRGQSRFLVNGGRPNAALDGVRHGVDVRGLSGVDLDQRRSQIKRLDEWPEPFVALVSHLLLTVARMAFACCRPVEVPGPGKLERAPAVNLDKGQAERLYLGLGYPGP
jgi:hypothetical protein